jgi:hypothetical protein
MAALQPLIHRNSELRIRWNDLRTGFNDLVGKMRSFLAEHGIEEPPVLAALPAVVVPILWIAAAVAVVALVHEINAGINSVGEAFRKLGPIGSTALALTPLIALVAGLVIFGPQLKRRFA